MEGLTRDLSHELPQELQFDKYAQQILENSKSVVASTPTITTLSGSDFLQKLSVSIFNSINLQNLKQNAHQSTTSTTISSKMDFDMIHNHVAIDSSSFGDMDELQKQLEYDKFMNDVWIGIVLTLIVISMVFCICSCFLYHQFRTWKRNYSATAAQSQHLDIESMKLNPDHEDPVPEYTLVSGLPSYEAALELLHKTPNNTCVIVYPSVFSVFNKHEKSANSMVDMAAQQQQLLATIDATTTTPLMATETTSVKSLPQHSDIPSYAEAAAATNVTLTAVNEKSQMKKSATTITATPHVILQKVPSYEEAFLVKNDKCL